MKIQYDRKVDAAYIYVQFPIKHGEVKKTVSITDDIAIDFDAQGKLLGVEVLDASKLLKKELLKEAELMSA